MTTTVPISELVPVTGTVTNTGFTGVTTAMTVLTKNALVPYNDTQAVLQFNSLQLVGDFFGVTSDEYNAATNYFQTYDNSPVIPAFINFARYIDIDTAPSIQGGAGASLATLQAITDGEVTFAFDGQSLAVSGSPVTTGNLPVGMVQWNDNGSNYLTVLNNTATLTIETFILTAGVWTVTGVAAATGTNPQGLTYFKIGTTNYISVVDLTDETIRTYAWNGTSFVQVQNLALGVATQPYGVFAFTAGITQFVAITNNGLDTFSTLYWTDSGFAPIATNPTISTGTSPTAIVGMLVEGTQYVLISAPGSTKVNVFKWNGSYFVAATPDVSTASAGKLTAYVIAGTHYFTVCNTGANTISTYSLDTVANVFNLVSTESTGISPAGIAFYVSDSVNYLAVSNYGSSNLYTYTWNGTTWIYNGIPVVTGLNPATVISCYIGGMAYVEVLNYTDGTLSTFLLSVGGTTLTGIDLSGAASFSDIASILQAAYILAGVTLGTVTYSSLTQAFTVSNGNTSGTGTVTYSPVTPLATALMLTQAMNALLSQGTVGLSVAQNLDNITAITRNWTSFTNLWDISTDLTYAFQLAAIQWCDTQQNNFIYICWSQEAALKTYGSGLAQAVVDAGYGTQSAGQITYSGTWFPQFGSVNLATFIGGIGASFGWNRRNGVVSFASKTQAGLAPTVTNLQDYTAILANGFNCYAVFGAKAQNYTFTETGKIGGIYVYGDFFYGYVWLSDYIQNTLATMLGDLPYLPNNDTGYKLLKSVLNSAMQRAIFNGVAQTGNTFNALTKADLLVQAGYDITPTLTQQGYVIQIIPSVNPAGRVPPVTNIWYADAGSINQLPVNLDLVF